MKVSNLSRAADTVQQQMLWTSMKLALSALVFSYSLLLMFDFNVMEILPLEPKVWGVERGEQHVPFLLYLYSLVQA